MKTLYHGTSSIHLSDIKAKGIVPGRANGGDAYAKKHHWKLAALAGHREPSVFVTDDVRNAEQFSRFAAEEVGGEPVVVTLHVPVRTFARYKVDELYEEDAENKPHAWKAPHVEARYVGEVIPVSPAPSIEEEVLALLEAMAEMEPA